MNEKDRCYLLPSSFQPPQGCVQLLVFQREAKWTVKPTAKALKIHHQKYGGRNKKRLTLRQSIGQSGSKWGGLSESLPLKMNE